MWFRKKKKGEEVVAQPPDAGILRKREATMPALKLFCYTEQGNRKYQQDAVYVSANGIVPLSSNKAVRVLAAVCDGMGGMEDGGKASQTAVRMLGEDFAKVRNHPSVLLSDFLLSEVRRIDEAIYQSSGGASGTTIVAVAVENDQLHWISAGDSRIYLLRQGTLEQKTKDHNYMYHLMKKGMPREEAEAQKGSEALISFLGIGNIRLVDRNIQPFQLRLNDMLLLCSDGITKTIPDTQIQEILLSRTSSIEQKAKVLVQAATRKNTRSQDNTSAVILEYVTENAKEYKRMEQRL